MEVDQMNYNGGRNQTDADMDYQPASEQQEYEETPTNPYGFFNDTKTAAACSVRVALRVRPLVGRELYESPNICVSCYPDSNQIIIGKDRPFTFDKIFDIGTRQQDIFETCVKNLVLGCFSGYNATVLAYGQTGSGKTFTMGSGYTIGLKDEDLGIIPRVIRLIFDEVDKRKQKAEFIIKCTFLEIYNEELNDLLDHSSVSNSNAGSNAIDRFIQKKEITIREEKNGNISVFGLREEKVNTYEELAACLDRGSNFRSTASTLMNNCSSRSHAIFTISIEQHIIDDLYQPNQPASTAPASQDHEEFMVAKFHFVDLAGSERAKRTGATGNTLKEGISINKGLLALGNVISALTEEGKKNNHVPYRDSKLTRILQDSLGGNSRTSMIACVSPAEINFEETLNTLKYASRARNIKNKPIVNRDPNSQQIAQLRQQVYELTRELVGARKLLVSNNIEFESSMAIPHDLSMLESKGMDTTLQGHSQREFMLGGKEIEKYEQEIKELKALCLSKDKKLNQGQSQQDHLTEQLSQTNIELFSVQKERDLARFHLEQMVQILKKRKIYDDIMKELHGYDKNSGMDIDERNEETNIFFGNSGPTILEEYQVKVSEQSKEIQEKTQQIKNLQRELESQLKASQQDLKTLETKEQEIERLKRSVNKIQKENVTYKNDQRRGTAIGNNNAGRNPMNVPAQSTAMRKMSMVPPLRPPSTPFGGQKTFKMGEEEKEDWISTELDKNIKNFNQMFIDNLSQSLSTMLVKKGVNDTHISQDISDISKLPASSTTDFLEHIPGQDSDSEDSQDSGVEDNTLHEIESQILPSNEKDQQVIIESNEEAKKQDFEIKNFLMLQENQILNIEQSIEEKEAILKQIKEAHAKTSNQLLEVMKNEYHKKIQLFQQEMSQLEQQKIEDLKKVENAQQKSKLEEGFRKKLKDLEDKLRDAKQKERDQQILQKEQTANKIKIQTLEREIEKFKSQKVSLVRQMKEESEKHRKWKAERVKELLQAKQANVKKDREIQQLKRENKKKDQFAKQKQQELTALMKKQKLQQQKQINAQKDRHQKKNIDVGQIQNWIITNTEKMLKFKEISIILEQELIQKQQVEAQINDEQSQLAQLSVRREKLEYQRCQLEQNLEQDFDQQIYEMNDEINSISYEAKMVQDSIETLEEKFDFIENKVLTANNELQQYSPNEIEQLNFDAVQSIEGARACLGAFFNILLDVNVENRQLKTENNQNMATIESISQLMEQLRQTQQANEVAFQREIESLNLEWDKKQQILVKFIMENGGQEFDQRLTNFSLSGNSDASQLRDIITKSLSLKEDDEGQPSKGHGHTSHSNGPQKRNNMASNPKQMEIQKKKETQVNESKAFLSRRVAELERKTKDDQKKLESIRHKFEQSNQEKDHFKKQLDNVKQKLKNQEIMEVKQSKIPLPEEYSTQNYSTREQQKSPRHNPQQLLPQQQPQQPNIISKLQPLKDLRNDRKKAKQQNQQAVPGKKENEPRVIADEPMFDEDEDEPLQVREIKNRGQLTAEQAQKIHDLKNLNQPQQPTLSQTSSYVPFGQVLQTQPSETDSQAQSNVFTRLSQGKQRPQTSQGNGGSNSLNNSISMGNPATNSKNDMPFKVTAYEDDKNWKVIVNKEMAHFNGIYAVASVGNQLYSASNKSLKIWDLEGMTQISDIAAHKGPIKSVTVWRERKILITASEMEILLWDMVSLTQVGRLQSKSEVKAITVSPDDRYLFSGGKGDFNNPGLLIWDLRKGSQLLEEREKNQDIFTLLATNDTLFYGCRSHQVIPYRYRTQEQMMPLAPPHFDAVTSLAMLDDVLVSGARDKMFRFWEHKKFQHLGYESVHSDVINTLETDQLQKELYSGSKDGIVKVWSMKDQKIRCQASLTASTVGASINCITRIEKQAKYERCFATGSQDKCLKIWKWKGQDPSNYDVEMNAREDDEFFERTGFGRNNDYQEEGGLGESIYEQYTDQRMFSQHNKLEETKMQQEMKMGYAPIGTYDRSSTYQIGRTNTAPVGMSGAYVAGSQTPGAVIKIDAKKRQQRLQDQQRRNNQKENEMQM